MKDWDDDDDDDDELLWRLNEPQALGRMLGTYRRLCSQGNCIFNLSTVGSCWKICFPDRLFLLLLTFIMRDAHAKAPLLRSYLRNFEFCWVEASARLHAPFNSDGRDGASRCYIRRR